MSSLPPFTQRAGLCNSSGYRAACHAGHWLYSGSLRVVHVLTLRISVSLMSTVRIRALNAYERKRYISGKTYKLRNAAVVGDDHPGAMNVSTFRAPRHDHPFILLAVGVFFRLYHAETFTALMRRLRHCEHRGTHMTTSSASCTMVADTRLKSWNNSRPSIAPGVPSQWLTHSCERIRSVRPFIFWLLFIRVS
jgi:hypothetical protein